MPSVKYRKCKQKFASGNMVYCHIRKNCFKRNFLNNEPLSKTFSKIFLKVEPVSASAYVTTRSATAFKKIESLDFLNAQSFLNMQFFTIIKLSANSALNISTGYEFRNWYYVTANVKLFKSFNLKLVYFDTDCFLILINKAFLVKQAPDFLIKTIAFSIIVKGINFDNYFTD